MSCNCFICCKKNYWRIPRFLLKKFKIESILSHYLKLVNVSFRSASKKRKVVLDFSTPPAPSETPFDQPIPPKSANNLASPTKREEDSFYAGLQRACPTAVALSLHAKHSDSFVPKCMSGTAPRPLDQLYDSSVPCDIYNDVLLHCDYQHQCHRGPGAVRRAADREAEQEQAVVLDASRPSDCIDLLRRLSHAHRETCHVRASFDLHAKRPQVLVCSHRVGKHARVGRSRPVRGPSHCPTHRRCVSGVRAVPQHCVPDVRRQPGWASQCTCCAEGLVEIKCPLHFAWKRWFRSAGLDVLGWQVLSQPESPPLLPSADAAVRGQQVVLRLRCVVAGRPVRWEDLPW